MKTEAMIRSGMNLFLILLVGLALVSTAIGQEGGRRGRRGGMNRPQGNEAATEEQKAPEKKETTSPITAIVGGDIHTVTGPVIRRGTVLIQDGKILDVGQDLEVPEGAEVIDATGKTITPGFVAISMQGIGFRGAPGNREQLKDLLDPFDRNMKYSLGVGITTGCVELSSGRGGRRRRPREGEAEERFPGLDPEIQEYVTEAMLDYGDLDTSLCPCCGLPVLPTEPITPSPPAEEQPRSMAAIKLSYGNVEAMLLREDVFYSPSPGALNGALNRHNWRRTIKKAREALEEQEKKQEENKSAGASAAANRGSRGNAPGGSGGSGRSNSSSNEEVQALVKGEVAMRVRANTADEVRDMVALARELDYRIVIEGGVEAWVVADELGAAMGGVIYTPRQRREARPDNEDQSGSNIESTRIFQETGIPFSTASLSNSVSMNGLAGRDLTSLPLEAAFAVRGGASEQTALESITITPARMMGLEDRIGSIEKGKDADLLILNGGPLDFRTYVEKAVVAGEVAYDREADRVYPVHQR